MIAAVVFWLALALSLVSVIPYPYSLFIVWIGVLVLVIHLLEYLLVKYRYSGRYSGEMSFVKTILFGFTYWLPLLICDRGRAGDG